MNLISQTYSGTTIPFPIVQDNGGLWKVGAINIDNQTGATLTIKSPGGQPLAMVPSYSPRSFLVPDWNGFQIATDGTALIASDFLNVQATDRETVENLPPFVLSAVAPPRGWGSGASANSLRSIAPGDAFLAWQVNQFRDLLTGVMTGQAVVLSNELRLRNIFAPNQFGDLFTDASGVTGLLGTNFPQQAAIFESAVTVLGAPQIGFLGASPASRPAISGSQGGNAALASLLSALATFGLVTDSTTAGGLTVQGRQIANLANGGTAQFPPVSGNGASTLGFALVTDQQDGAAALVAIQSTRNAAAILTDNLGIFSAVAGTANKTNIYYSAGNAQYELENNRGATRTYLALFVTP